MHSVVRHTLPLIFLISQQGHLKDGVSIQAQGVDGGCALTHLY